MNISTPKDMNADLAARVEKVISLFEEQLRVCPKGLSEYYLYIDGELSPNEQGGVEKLYKEAGWESVFCENESKYTDGNEDGRCRLILIP